MFFDAGTRPAEAFQVIKQVNVGAIAGTIARLGDRVYTTDTSGNVRVYDANTYALLGTITGCASSNCREVFTFNGRVYVAATNTLHEVDSGGGFFFSRSVSTNGVCTGHGVYNSTTILCPDATNNQIDRIVITPASMTKTDGGSINTGTFACSQPDGVDVDTTHNVMYVQCVGTVDRLVAIFLPHLIHLA